jgi:hypothetical protein
MYKVHNVHVDLQLDVKNKSCRDDRMVSRKGNISSGYKLMT